MANLDASIDAVFNGHTHQKYVFDQPVTGGDQPDAADRADRPVRRERRPDPARPTTPRPARSRDNAASNTARVATSDADLIANPNYGSQLQQVKNTVDAALANAKVVKVTSPVGKIAGDITTAFTGGTYVNGKYTGGNRDDRGSESALGDLVADALRDGIPAAQGKADLGIVNPGGLRDELLYAGSTATNPANTDGTVTYAEANAVLPFVNNIWLVQLTGRQLKSVLEQQWQPVRGATPVPRAGPVRQRPRHPGRQQARRQPDHRRAGRRCAAGQRQDLHGQHVLVPRHRWRQLHRVQGRQGQGHRPGRP